MSEILLNRAAYLNNLSKICSKAGGKERVILVLKDNAYGHGAKLIASEAAKFGIKFAAVKDEREANELDGFFDQILILSHLPNGNESDRFIYGVNELSNLQAFKSGTKIHLAIDTLMHRNGIILDEVEAACRMAKQNSLKILGAYTHFRSADELNSDYFVQRENFKIAKEKILKYSGLNQDDLIFHSHNSAGLERFKELKNEYVRIGIAQYGYAQFDDSLNLERVMELWANRISRRELKKGQCVGYGAKFCADRNMVVATYDLGYADGLLRYDGEGELILPNGKKMLGKMSMDSFSCEDSGDKICVFEDAREFAKFFNTIEYDVLSKLSPNLKRRWV